MTSLHISFPLGFNFDKVQSENGDNKFNFTVAKWERLSPLSSSSQTTVRINYHSKNWEDNGHISRRVHTTSAASALPSSGRK